MRAHTFETILVPVDFSEISAHALRTASLLAARCGRAKIIAMYANWFEAPPYFTVGRLAELQAEFSESLQLAGHSLEVFVRSTLGDNADSVEVRAMEALPADGIRQLAALKNANLIVMGTHGRSGLNRWMLGSVAERVLRESPVPVLTVRSAPRETIQQVLCPVQDTELSRRALSFAAGISACFDATLTVLHVDEASGTRPISDLCSWVPAEERARCVIRELVRHGGSHLGAAEAIVKLATEEPYDLVVLGAARRRFFEGMVLGTTTLRTVRHAPCPVLTVGSGAEMWETSQDRQ
jgi:nucleotide-binding universal stress UspA family protein